MSGVWVGDWGVGTDGRQRVVIVLDWQGTQLSGVINPGQAAVPVKVARVDPSDWSVHLEAEAKAAGRSEQWVLDGKLDDLGKSRDHEQSIELLRAIGPGLHSAQATQFR